jgi:hypothetical protein
MVATEDKLSRFVGSEECKMGGVGGWQGMEGRVLVQPPGTDDGRGCRRRKCFPAQS